MAMLCRKSSSSCLLVFILSFFTMTPIIIYYNFINPVQMVTKLIVSLSANALFDYTNLQDDQWVVRTPACNIQRLDPFDPSAMRYFIKLPFPTCPTNNADVLVILRDDGQLVVNRTARASLMDYTDENEISEIKNDFYCRMWKISRNWIENSDRSYRTSKTFVEFIDQTTMDNEYSQVECYRFGKPIYHNYFFRVIRKPQVEAKCELNERLHRLSNSQCNGVEALSVLVIGVDSVSKSNFVRQFPLTFDLLANNLLALDFHGYNKVGLNTFPCLIPYLTGNSTDELRKSCWGGGMNTFDNCKFLWDMFEDAGYRTAFVENLDEYGLFMHNKAGRKRQLAHYYGHTLYMPVEHYVRNFYNGCWRGKTDDEMVLEWAYQFQWQFYQTPHFGHFWMSKYTHDNFNTAQHDDPALSDAIGRMHKQRLLNNTLLIVMSDHGIRYGDYRETEMGRQEENLPFLFMVFPQWFQDKYPQLMERMYRNRFRLITTFDLHEMLKSIINCDYKNPPAEQTDDWESRKRGVSLFHNISPNRTCEDAGIPNIYCACKQHVVDIDTQAPIVSKLSNELVKKINLLITPHRSLCAMLNLNAVIFVKQVTKWTALHSPLKSSSNSTTYIVAIVTQPGGAKFEASVQHFHYTDEFVVNQDIRRINRYGNTSKCIKTDGLVKSICYCK